MALLTGHWLSRQLTEAFRWDTEPHFLMRDRDAAYGHAAIVYSPKLYRTPGNRKNRPPRLRRGVTFALQRNNWTIGNGNDRTHPGRGRWHHWPHHGVRTGSSWGTCAHRRQAVQHQ